MLEAKSLSVSFQRKEILKNISFTLKEGQWLMLLGQNGAGKSTLLNAVAQTIPYDGEVLLDDRDARAIDSRAFARKIGVLAQLHDAPYGYTVEQIVALGRYAHSRAFGGQSLEDRNAVARALREVGLWEMRDRRIESLSGGERQRAFLAQAFAQQPSVLLLDEPGNHLDIKFQEQLYELLHRWLSPGGRAVISVMHDLNSARMNGTHALLLKDGHSVAYGAVERVMTRQHLTNAFDMDVFAYYNTRYLSWVE